MSSSSSSTQPIRAPAPDPPKGWLDDEIYLKRSYYWSGKSGDVKDTLNKFYGLSNANPIWVNDPDFGNVLFIFQATPKSGGTLNYVWNDIEKSVCRITGPATLEEIRQSIQKFGGDEGTFDDLVLEEITPP